MKYIRQVDKVHYSHKLYGHLYRWISYYYQLEAVTQVTGYLKKPPKKVSIMEIGPGDKTVNTMLQKYGYEVKTMDIAEDIRPDFVCSLPNIPLKNKVDIILCCEVLEHIQYEDTEKSLKNMSRKTEYLIISVPHKSLYISLILRLPIINPIKIFFAIPTPFIKHKFDGQHYWELGTKGYSVKRFKNSIRLAGLDCLNDFRVKEFPYHHFFLLKIKKRKLKIITHFIQKVILLQILSALKNY